MVDLYKGDTWEFEYRIKAQNGIAVNLLNYKVRAGIKDSAGVIKLKSNTSAGGSDAELKILDTKGNALITYDKEDTEVMATGVMIFEIEITSDVGKRYTVVHDSYNVIDDIV